MIKSTKLVFATSKNIRVSLKKVNLILEKLRGKSYKEAILILHHITEKSSDIVWQTLYSAVSNASKNYKLNKAKLFIVKAYVTGGPILKRMRARAKGRAFGIQKRMSNIKIAVGEII